MDLRRGRLDRAMARKVLRGLALLFLQLGGSVAGQAQLDEGCTVSVLNRTVQVSADGTFTVDNVPVSQAAFRTRVVCDGSAGAVALFQSDFLFGVPGGETLVGPLLPGDAAPVPVVLTVASPITVLTQAQTSTQLVSTGFFPDGTEADLSTAATGTFYVSSNPAIATVSSDGLVDAVSSGRVLMTATHEGVLATLGLQVSLTEDSDGDGLPDDFERLNSVDPGGGNLATRPGVTVLASSFATGFTPERIIDGSLGTSWFTAAGDAANQGTAPFIEVTLANAARVAQARIFGNREAAGRDVFAGVFHVFDADGFLIFDSGEVRTTPIGRDAAVVIELDGVQRVRFTSTSDQGSSPGIAELRIVSSPGGLGLDPEDPSDAAADFDGDGLSNLQEFELGTSLFLTDTDGDRLSDLEEIGLGSSPTLPDSDLDGLLDGDEVDPTADVDNDGLINVLDPDSDNDGLLDGFEFGIAGDNTSVDPNGDNDGDGLLNIDEADLGTDATRSDTDNDGLDDLEEALGPTSPVDPDSDDDGFSDGFEAEYGSDPADPTSVPDLSVLDGESTTLMVSILNLIDPGDPTTFDPILSAVTPTYSILNFIDPEDPTTFDPILDAVTPTYSVLNFIDSEDPTTFDPILDAVTPTYSFLNLIDPEDPTTFDPILDAVTPTYSILNLIDPEDPTTFEPVLEFVTPTYSLLNLIDPEDPATFDPVLQVVTPLFSIFAGPESQLCCQAEKRPKHVGAATSREVPMATRELLPRVAIEWPPDGSTLFEGETVVVRAEAHARSGRHIEAVEFSIDAVPFATVTSEPYEMAWTVPRGLDRVRLQATVRDHVGEVVHSDELLLTVEPDPLTTVCGQVFDSQGEPVAGAAVDLYLQGSEARFFDLGYPLDASDLADLDPDGVEPVSAINFRNPGGLLAGTMLGEPWIPDFAVVFSGLLEVPRPGIYGFVLAAGGRARLTVAGEQIVEVAETEGFAEAIGWIELEEGTVPISVEYVHGFGVAEVQLFFLRPDGDRRIVPTVNLLQARPLLTSVTGVDGSFVIEDVPTVLGDVTLRVTAGQRSGETQSVWSAPVEIVPGGLTECGRVTLSAKATHRPSGLE